MSLALNALYDLPENMHWTLGGGTALYLQINHRASRDIDIFFESTKAIRLLAGNPKIKEISSNRQFPGNYLKLIREEGEIDFIAASSITDIVSEYEFEGKNISLDGIEEINAKKIKYRGSQLTYRDVYDLSASISKYPDLIQKLLAFEDIKEMFPKALQKIYCLQKNLEKQKEDVKNFIINGDNYILNNMFDIAIENIKESQNQYGIE